MRISVMGNFGMLFNGSKKFWLVAKLDISPQAGDLDEINTNIKNISLTGVDRFCFVYDQIKKVTVSQEISAYTYSHCYCLDEGDDKNSFDKDLVSAIRISIQYDVVS